MLDIRDRNEEYCKLLANILTTSSFRPSWTRFWGDPGLETLDREMVTESREEREEEEESVTMFGDGDGGEREI